MTMPILSQLLSAIDNGSIPSAVVEKTYKRLHALFKERLPDGPIVRDGEEVLDKKHLCFYMLMEFTVSEVSHAFYVVLKEVNP